MSENYEDCLQNFSIKQEPLETCIKEEPSDDEFVETPIKSVLKQNPNVFSYETLEPNNNYTVKTEVVLNTIDEIDHKYEDQRTILKLEIEEEGIQYDCKENIKFDCPFCNKSFGTTRNLMKHMKKRFSCRYRRNSPKSFLKQISKPFKCQVCLKCKYTYIIFFSFQSFGVKMVYILWYCVLIFKGLLSPMLAD